MSGSLGDLPMGSGRGIAVSCYTATRLFQGSQKRYGGERKYDGPLLPPFASYFWSNGAGEPYEILIWRMYVGNNRLIIGSACSVR